jgi:hypothetical protein
VATIAQQMIQSAQNAGKDGQQLTK